MTTTTAPLYHSHWTLPDFQALAAAYGYERAVNLYVYDTGIGKSHIAMVTAAMLFEDHKIDLVVLCAERNKLDPDEWPKDLANHTRLSWVKYHGVPPVKREKLRDERPQVLLSTYETIKLDAAQKVKEPNQRGRMIERLRPFVLTEWIAQFKSVLFVYDEITKLGNRKSDLHKAHEVMVNELRQRGVEVRISGLTATPVEKSPENLYNVGRILIPHAMPTVANLERDYVAAKDIFGNYSKWKNLTPEECEPGVTPFRDLFKSILLRKRKTDPDVIDQFPQTVEEPPLYVKPNDRHGDFYNTVRETFTTGDEFEDRALITVLRQIAGHPMSLTLSQGKVATSIVEAVGEDGLRSIGASKVPRLIEYLQPIVKGQGAQVVLFSFFTSVIHFVQKDLEEAGYTVAPFHGGMSVKDRAESKAAWKNGDYEILFSSDAGAKGINLPEGQYGLEYEYALTRANQVQRLNRIHRIDSKHPSVTFRSMILMHTVEEGLANSNLRRNEWGDKVLDDEDAGENFITAKERRRLLAIGRKAVA